MSDGCQKKKTGTERFKTGVEIAKDIALIFALVAAGGWAAYRFYRVEDPSAKLDFEQALYQSRTFGLQMTMTISSFRTGRCRVFGFVTIQNIGAVTARLKTEQDRPISVALVRNSNNGRMVDSSTVSHFWIDDPDETPRTDVVVVPGRTVYLPFAFDVAGSGLYLVRFQSPVIFANQRANRPDPWSTRSLVRAC